MVFNRLNGDNFQVTLKPQKIKASNQGPHEGTFPYPSYETQIKTFINAIRHSALRGFPSLIQPAP